VDRGTQGVVSRRELLVVLSFLQRNPLDSAGRAAVRRILEHPKFELIPLKNVLDQARFLPDGATVSVTASPAKTLEDTMDLAAELQQRGFDVIPHLSARMTKDKAHLDSLLQRMEAMEVSRIFLVGGDAQEPGEFFDAYSLLQAMEAIGHHLTEIGVTAYPEGHHVISDENLRQALHDKQPYASYMTTQMCFDDKAITRFVEGVRADGITMPVYLGLPGVADRLKLLSISARIGVGQSMNFLSKNRGLITKFLKPGRYTPDELLEKLGATLADTAAGIEGVHIYTFNQCETTERWRQEYLADL
jgi:methylenetetrahydrofolate reductase (NADPH)